MQSDNPHELNPFDNWPKADPEDDIECDTPTEIIIPAWTRADSQFDGEESPHWN